MDVQLFILGTGHTLQCASRGTDAARVAAYEAELRRICTEYEIARVVEEMSRDGLSYQEVECTVGKRVVASLGLEHQMVDLELAERDGLSLGDGPMLNVVLNQNLPNDEAFRTAFDALGDAVRERVWIGRMLSLRSWPVLFICGADHTNSVEALWRSLALPVTVLHRDYEP